MNTLLSEQKIGVTPKDFFLWAGAMVAFYASVIAFINLIFEYLNYLYPDPLAYQVDPYQSGISSFMAIVIVAFPVYLVLMRIIRRWIMADPTRQEIWVRRWALVLTLFVAGTAIAGTLIVLLTTFLSGEELTTRFLLKIAVALLIAGAAFAHFFADIRGYWKLYPNRARNLGMVIEAIVITIIIAGFSIVGTPREARLARYDAERVNDLQSIQWQTVNYWQAKQKLPATLDDIKDSLSDSVLPVDPKDQTAYEYIMKGKLSFQLCATFSMETPKGTRLEGYPTPAYPYKDAMSENWQHGAGKVCFDRTIDPDRYPPLEKGSVAVPAIRF